MTPFVNIIELIGLSCFRQIIRLALRVLFRRWEECLPCDLSECQHHVRLLPLQILDRAKLTVQTPATEATIPPEMAIGLNPLVLLNNMPLRKPAPMLLAASCFPRTYPMYELMQLYTMATTPAELPKNGPRLVIAFRVEFSRSLGAWPALRLRPSCRPHAPPIDRAERYVIPVP